MRIPISRSRDTAVRLHAIYVATNIAPTLMERAGLLSASPIGQITAFYRVSQ